MAPADRRSGSAKYVFAGTRDREEELGTKICPRCGEELFSDMDVCYGCLYDFTRERGRSRSDQAYGGRTAGSRGRNEGAFALASGMPATGMTEAKTARERSDDPLDGIELDEIDGMDGDDDAFASTPRHGKHSCSPDDTLDLAGSDVVSISTTPDDEPPARPTFRLVADSTDMLVRFPLTRAGVMVGRAESNDIVLRTRSVSRSHLRLVPQDDSVLVEDCGATNPAVVAGKPLEGSAVLRPGEFVVVCGTSIGVEEQPPDPAA